MTPDLMRHSVALSHSEIQGHDSRALGFHWILATMGNVLSTAQMYEIYHKNDLLQINKLTNYAKDERFQM